MLGAALTGGVPARGVFHVGLVVCGGLIEDHDYGVKIESLVTASLLHVLLTVVSVLHARESCRR